jgi:hypothetical protein
MGSRIPHPYKQRKTVIDYLTRNTKNAGWRARLPGPAARFPKIIPEELADEGKKGR